MNKNHAFRPDAGEGLELRLAPSGLAAGAAAEIARVGTHDGHNHPVHNGEHKGQDQNGRDHHHKK